MQANRSRDLAPNAAHAYESGRLNTSLRFEELRRRGYIDEAARAANDAPDSSQRIRAGVPHGR